jgi:NAD(P)-dependent dehydrogenase (short-subunit alcohol dehydrogenase family)
MAFGPDDILRCTEVLLSIVGDRAVLDSLPELEQKRFLEAVGRIANPVRADEVRLQKSLRRKRKLEERDHDRALRAQVDIRIGRAAEVFRPLLPQANTVESQPEPPNAQSHRTKPHLKKARHCYVCKVEFSMLHHFYDSMCSACGDFNYAKRFQRADLQGRVALVTGGRVKIGFQTTLMLLRSGAEVVVTTRFPLDAAERYQREPDFPDWSSRVQVYGLDLRHAPSVELFARHLCQTRERLDILINNAAQTVRRPPGFYKHLLKKELMDVKSLTLPQQKMLASRDALLTEIQPGNAPGLANWNNHDSALGLHSSAALSLVPYAHEHQDDAQFPSGSLDADLQQVDLRDINSWRLTLGQVETSEMLEVHLVNAVAPFILCSKLKPLMLKRPERARHIVNVSAMEGIFSRGTKTDKHPHTNMAKAALNMLTLTASKDYVKNGIYMNAVDTGWVTDEDPHQHAQRKIEELDFQPPLDIVDGAARVVDPVLEAERTGACVSGTFFKDYRPGQW